MTAPITIDETMLTNRSAILRSLSMEDGVAMKADAILTALKDAGLQDCDPRLQMTLARLRALRTGQDMNEEELALAVVSGEGTLVSRALSGRLTVPDFASFRAKIEDLFERCRKNEGGDVASYIPQLARVSPDKYALSACTVDGQRFSLGDAADRFCIQSTCKPTNYAIARDLLGREDVHGHVGREPSGRTFNELTLNARGLPHNPMINAGAIMCASMIKLEAPLADRFDYIMETWTRLCGGRRPGFENAVYLSEKATADRNFALAYFMRENGAFPPHTKLIDTLEFYFQCCSITLDVEDMSIAAATLANGGVCPITNERVFGAETVKDCLSLMYSCGMYDFSGEYAFSVGIPAKSGVSGALMLVVPGVCGFAIWSPRLDTCGNSVRGVEFSKGLVEDFAFHSYASMVDNPQLIDPIISKAMRTVDETSQLCSAAARGDLSELRRLIAAGADICRADYDGRTPLHLAASEGQMKTAQLLLAAGADIEARDRWGNTALDDAEREQQGEMIALIGKPAGRLSGRKAKASA